MNKLPSFASMSRLALDDKAVSDRIARERFEQARDAFKGQEAAGADGQEEDLSWILKLTKDANGRFEKTINNTVLVLENDPLVRGKIVTDEFASCGMVTGRVPWNPNGGKRRWTDADDAGFYRYMESFYGITGREKLDNALLLVGSQNRVNEVKDYLQGSNGTASGGWTRSSPITSGRRTTPIHARSSGSPCAPPWRAA